MLSYSYVKFEGTPEDIRYYISTACGMSLEIADGESGPPVLLEVRYSNHQSPSYVLYHTGPIRRLIRSAGNLCLRHRLVVRHST